MSEIEKKYRRLFSKDEYAVLTRDGMYQALLYVSPTLAKGKSRAKKEELQELYAQAAATDSIPVVKVEETENGIEANAVDPRTNTEVDADFEALAKKVDDTLAQAKERGVILDEKYVEQVREDFSPAEVRVADEVAQTEQQPQGSAQGLPKLSGLDELNEFVRANPEMPPLEDGAVLQLPADEERMFTFRDGVERLLTDKEGLIVKDLQTHFEVFRNNPANSDAKRKTLDAIYRLKVCGIIANPKFVETVKEGRAYVRDYRRKMKTGADVREAVQEVKEEKRIEQAAQTA